VNSSDSPAGPRPRLGEIDQRFDAHGLGALRSALIAQGRTVDASEDWIDALLIVVGELTSNVIRHGGGTGRLRLWRDEEAFYCEVTDYGPGFADPTVGAALPDPHRADGGRGIWICRNLTTELIIHTCPDRTGATVTAVIPTPDQCVHQGATSPR
jgi:anti-sigma regulatory factor (Ser/Thr protein kinase)